ncbi:MAG TPA: hypothetical protein V6C97_08190 [Oculatellaceae cyanobacterium]
MRILEALHFFVVVAHENRLVLEHHNCLAADGFRLRIKHIFAVAQKARQDKQRERTPFLDQDRLCIGQIFQMK